MEPTNINMLYNSDFVDSWPLSKEPQPYKLLWWGLAMTEILLCMRIILEYFDTNLTSPFTYMVYTITYYFLYPFTVALNIMGKEEVNNGWITIMAITGYFLLTIALIGFLNSLKSPHSKIEQTRALHRKKYDL
jgi:hypothetical protein